MNKLLTFLAALLALLLFVFAIFALRAEPVPDHPFFAGLPDVAVIAHQGGEQLWPSNTMLAFQESAALGVDVLEMDVHATADGVLVLMHDETVDRTTGATGLIREMTFAELRALDAGYYWTPDEGATFPFRGQGIVVPTLEELFAEFPDMPMVVEIKQAEPSIAAPLCDLIHTYEKRDEVLVASFHDEALEEFRDLCPNVATAGSRDDILPFFVLNRLRLDAAYQSPAEAFEVSEYSGGLHVLTERFVEGAHRHNIDVHVWTINDTAEMQRFVDLGVDGIITDRPDRLLNLLGRGAP